MLDFRYGPAECLDQVATIFLKAAVSESFGLELVLRKMIVLNHRLNHPRVVDNVEGPGFLPFLPSKAHTCVPSYVW